MSPDTSAWLGQVPWGPLAMVVGVALLWGLSAVRGQKKKAVLAEALASGALVVDVRTKAEFAGGHYGGAVNIPLDTLNAKLKSLGAKDKAIVVYCASGARSAQAATLLRGAGFTAVTNAGGLGNLPRS